MKSNVFLFLSAHAHKKATTHLPAPRRSVLCSVGQYPQPCTSSVLECRSLPSFLRAKPFKWLCLGWGTAGLTIPCTSSHYQEYRFFQHLWGTSWNESLPLWHDGKELNGLRGSSDPCSGSALVHRRFFSLAPKITCLEKALTSNQPEVSKVNARAAHPVQRVCMSETLRSQKLDLIILIISICFGGSHYQTEDISLNYGFCPLPPDRAVKPRLRGGGL